jgi:hypothetical protein
MTTAEGPAITTESFIGVRIRDKTPALDRGTDARDGRGEIRAGPKKSR